LRKFLPLATLYPAKRVSTTSPEAFSMGNRRTLAAVVVSAVLLVPLAVLGAPAFATSVHSSSAQYEYGSTKVTICHQTGSATHPWVKLTISTEGWLNGHKKHSGDFVIASGASCPSTGTSPTATTTTAAPGKSGRQQRKSGRQHGKP
jgi:hypothetical protein